jgi:flavin reductase (DIM6/NTAB) family NADH-FMN oxidoreductase RutF
MPKSVLKFKNYDVHAIGSSFGKKKNLNIATWLMQSAMGGKMVVVALFKPDLTLELVKASGRLCVSLLAENQANLITKLGRRSGRNSDKLKNLDFGLDSWENPYLNGGIGYMECEVISWADGGDHELAICKVLKSKTLNPKEKPLTLNYLREKNLVRG